MANPVSTEEVFQLIHDTALEMAAEETRAHLYDELRKKRIGHWRIQTYLDGVEYAASSNGLDASMDLRFKSKAAQTIEEGVPSFSLKDKLEQNKGVTKPSPGGGWYKDVPFYRLSTEEVEGDTRTAPLGRHPLVTKRIATPVEAAMKERYAQLMEEGELSQPYPRQNMRLEPGMFPTKRKPTDTVGFNDEMLLNNNFLIRQGKGTSILSRFATIRRISSSSPSEKWVIPEQPGVGLQRSAETFFKQRFDDLQEVLFKQFFG